MRDINNPQPGDAIIWWPTNNPGAFRPAFGFWTGKSWKNGSKTIIVHSDNDWTFIPSPYVHKPQVGDVVENDDAKRLHIHGLVILSFDGEACQWNRNYGWQAVGTESELLDNVVVGPVTVLHVPEADS